jgi:hypothetical protein
VALNSNCQFVGCGPASPQIAWLEGDLLTHPSQCTLAYFHHPRFSSGFQEIRTPGTRSFWNALYARGVDVILNGHDHHYERFAAMAPDGSLDAKNGIREFVVGTGGRSREGWRHIERHSRARDSHTFGVLKMTLHPHSYRWRFKPVRGSPYTDSGEGDCH